MSHAINIMHFVFRCFKCFVLYLDFYLLASSPYETNSSLFDLIENNRPKIMDCFWGCHMTPTTYNIKPVHLQVIPRWQIVPHIFKIL